MDNCVSLGWIYFLSSHHALCHDSFVSCRLNHIKQALIVRWEDVAGAENMILIVKQAEVNWSCFCSAVTRWSQSPRWHGRLTRSQESDNQTLIIQHVSHTSECNLETYARRLVVSDSKAPSKPFTLKTLNLNSSSSPAQYQGSVW